MTVTQRDRGETPESQRPPAIRTKTSETETHSDQRDSPRDSNTEIRTVRRNWTSSSPSPPSPMMSRPEVLGLRSVAKRRGPKAGRVGWGRVGVGDLWGRQRHPRRRWNCVEDSCAGQSWEEVPAPGSPLEQDGQGHAPLTEPRPQTPNLGQRYA